MAGNGRAASVAVGRPPCLGGAKRLAKRINSIRAAGATCEGYTTGRTALSAPFANAVGKAAALPVVRVMESGEQAAPHDCDSRSLWTAALRREGDGSCPGECQGQPGEHGEVGVKLDALKTENPEGGERVFVLQPCEFGRLKPRRRSTLRHARPSVFRGFANQGG